LKLNIKDFGELSTMRDTQAKITQIEAKQEEEIKTDGKVSEATVKAAVTTLESLGFNDKADKKAEEKASDAEKDFSIAKSGTARIIIKGAQGVEIGRVEEHFTVQTPDELKADLEKNVKKAKGDLKAESQEQVKAKVKETTQAVGDWFKEAFTNKRAEATGIDGKVSLVQEQDLNRALDKIEKKLEKAEAKIAKVEAEVAESADKSEKARDRKGEKLKKAESAFSAIDEDGKVGSRLTKKAIEELKEIAGQDTALNTTTDKRIVDILKNAGVDYEKASKILGDNINYLGSEADRLKVSAVATPVNVGKSTSVEK
jgi:hypothetical protein